MRAIGLMILAAISLSACAVDQVSNQPIPTMLPNNKPGFGMRGIIQFTPEEAKARQEIEGIFVQACSSAVKIHSLKMEKYTGPINNGYTYAAVAECL
ncbi:hypothetical protein SAMN02982917_3968 [Azospirillum oryzae]|uniref:Uncharacterized protein n=1 Tax=Azospirillum oryzae TaxID=286727 RepID=A0A1X7GKT4_9PROT|nr:hypothetical protein [Azospirillum oryzae]SMF71210.1 hypothetical protein SAMN02982917_3968 [Azospirillum oryzae]